ncbi:helix-turn-helix domain-containing protein [Streptomyces sp. bgisy100]|uniref:helix-turn-helix domain-containing protein n=1 Tax=Streptomyces sp. bgisy100 TaxID=3413783 RepID=UPI003D761989
MRLRTARTLAGKSQAALGAECGISQKQISRFERGQTVPGDTEIRLLARALEIDPSALAHGATGAAQDAGSYGAGGNEDDVLRRNFVTAGLGIGTAAVLPSATAVAAPATPTDWDRALYTTNTAPNPSSNLSSTQLSAGLGTVARHLAATRYAEAEKALPRLIVAARASAGRSGRRGAELLTRAWALATAVKVKERHPDAWSTSSWAVEAAERSQHPLALAMAARGQYICLRQHGQHRQARMVAENAVADLVDEELARPVLGHLLLESAYGAAQAGRTADAEALWEHARSLARKGSTVAIWPDYPGPLTREQVDRYALCIHHTLGDTRRAVGHMEALNAAAVDVPHTAARIRHDSAKLRRDIGDMSGALRLLQNLSADTPQDARRTQVRTMVSGMMHTTPHLPGLRPFAASLGAV